MIPYRYFILLARQQIWLSSQVAVNVIYPRDHTILVYVTIDPYVHKPAHVIFHMVQMLTFLPYFLFTSYLYISSFNDNYTLMANFKSLTLSLLEDFACLLPMMNELWTLIVFNWVKIYDTRGTKEFQTNLYQSLFMFISDLFFINLEILNECRFK